MKIGELRWTDDWPIFGEMSALSAVRGSKLSCSVVAETRCKIQVIPIPLFQAAVRTSKTGLQHFYEAMCRHYAQKLRLIHRRGLSKTDDSSVFSPVDSYLPPRNVFSLPKSKRSTLFHYHSLSINGEPVIYSWSCKTSQDNKKDTRPAILSLSKSFLALKTFQKKGVEEIDQIIPGLFFFSSNFLSLLLFLLSNYFSSSFVNPNDPNEKKASNCQKQ